MDKREAKRKAINYVNAVRDVVKFDKAVLFGSYANGKPEEYSDSDIGLFMNRLDDNVDYLKLMSSLYHVAVDIDILIEPHLFIRVRINPALAKRLRKKGSLSKRIGK